MRLPTRVCYAILSIVELAMSQPGRPTKQEEIAGRYGLSQPYLSQVLLQLVRSGMVASNKGRSGGYSLAADAADVSLGMVVQAVEKGAGAPACISHTQSADNELCRLAGACPARALWQNLANAGVAPLESVSVADVPAVCSGLWPRGRGPRQADTGADPGARAVGAVFGEAASADAIITLDGRGRVMLLNRPGRALIGWQQEEAVGRPAAELFWLTDREGESLIGGRLAAEQALSPEPRAGTGGAFMDQEAVLLGRDGRERPVWARASALPSVGGQEPKLVIALEDLAPRRKAEDAMLRLNQLETLGSAVDRTSQEFNNLLTGIIGDTSLALLETEMDSAVAEALEQIQATALAAKALNHQLVSLEQDLSVATTGSTALVPAPISVGRLLERSYRYALLQPGSTLYGARLQVESAPDVWAIQADESQVAQAFYNLLLNAEEAMPKGGLITVSAENVTGPEGLPLSPGEYVRLTVADEGEGISEALLGRVFEPHFTTKAGHSGLGLTTSYIIVRRQGGHLDVASPPGSGASFHVYLPAVRRQPELVQGADGASVQLRPRILVMDDDDVVKGVFTRMLEKLGYEVELATEGKEAIELFGAALQRGRRFDAVILDHKVAGGMGGEATLAGLRQVDPRVRAILVTGHPEDIIVEEYAKAGFADVMIKPVAVGEMKDVLAGVLSRARRGDR
ncbi:MAG: Rrf2 family transcriptional regulator [Anaerolineae bacterium]